ncbi:MAG: restriction endonuclease [Bacillota bacterium]
MRPRAFVVVASSMDAPIAELIHRELEKAGHRVLLSFADMPETEWWKDIHYSLGPGGTVIPVISSNSANSEWLLSICRLIDYELNPRSILLIPVLLGGVRYPGFLQPYRPLDLGSRDSPDIRVLLSQIEGFDSADLTGLSHTDLELLIMDLLREYGFTDVRRSVERVDPGDISAMLSRRDVFGNHVTEVWAVELKASRTSDTRSLSAFVDELKRAQVLTHGLFITTGRLTSAAREWLAAVSSRDRVVIRTMEGDELVALLVAKPGVLQKHLGTDGRGGLR